MTLPDCMMPDGADPCKGYTELYEQAKVAAAFLDVLAHHITRWPAVGNHLKEQQQAAADCRKMAERLRT